jgi:CheY-like chemotaxis protein/signal transduction histidine kinase
LAFLAAVLPEIDAACDPDDLLRSALAHLLAFTGAASGRVWRVVDGRQTLVPGTASPPPDSASSSLSEWIIPAIAGRSTVAGFELLADATKPRTPSASRAVEIFAETVARRLAHIATQNVAASADHSEELLAARNAAVAADRARTAFFAAVSHDLRTPIHGVLAATDQLRRGDGQGTAALVRTIEASSHELLERLDELLALAKPPTQESLHPVAANISETLTYALSAYDRLFASGRSVAVVRIDPGLNTDVIVAKAGLLRLVDALFAEFMLVADPSRISIDFTLVGSNLTIVVRGFAAPVNSGAWALVKQAVKAIEGSLETSDSDARPLVIRVPVAPVTSRRHGDSQRVLLVDDTAVTRQLGEAMVHALGFQVDTADGGTAAIAAVQEKAYGLVLMDLRMPDLDGISATQAIRAGQAGQRAANTPIVALTAHAIAGAREEALLAGMDDFVTKPFSRDSLKRVLDRFIPPLPDKPVRSSQPSDPSRVGT